MMAATHAGVTTYAPMTELLADLRANGFKTFIVSGVGVEFMRVFSERVYGVPPEQVVGSSIRTEYEVRDGKPVGINCYIGRRPILAFGNSDGDFQMLEYTTSAPGPRLDEAAQRGWVVVSVKSDWRGVYAAAPGK